MNNIPIPADLKAEDVVALAEGNDGREIVAIKLQASVDKVGRLITTNPDAIEMIAAAKAEMEAWGRLRVAMMVPEALDTLHNVMYGPDDDSAATARTKAAEAIMDRSYLPRQSARLIQTQTNEQPVHHILPTLGEVVERAETDSEALELMKRHRELVNEVEALRRGAKEIIDVRPEEKA